MPDADSAAAPRLLLCDDSPVERLALGHYLRSSGYHVDEAGDAPTALDILKTRQIDALLLDLHMPGPDGFDVLNYLQEHRRSLPVILMSGMPPDQIQDKMHVLRRPELPPLLLKPIDPQQLIEVLELQLSGQMPEMPEAQPSSVDPSVRG